jgi:hypothetical protein
VNDPFDELQRDLESVWPVMTLRTTDPVMRSVVVLHSMPEDLVPPQLAPLFPAYEERFLCLVLSLLRSPGSRVIYLTSQPILPRVVDYWFGLRRGLDSAEARSRLFLISPVDGSPRSLTAKLLERPRLLDRIRLLVIDPRLAVLLPFLTREAEAELALKLRVPVYGSAPRLWRLGSKSSARRLFREEGIPLPKGAEGIATRADLRAALTSHRAERPGLRLAIVKLDQGVSGLGNATIRLDQDDLDAAIGAMELEDTDTDAEAFLAALEAGGGVVEERLTGDEFRSPSVQLRASPSGEVEVLSTHDQVLGGRQGLSFLGSRFPADGAYGPMISDLGLRIGERLAREGAMGRFAIDFVVVRDRDGRWSPYAIEINLRCGGTTHTFSALQLLTDGVFDASSGVFVAPDGRPRFYAASDHVEGPDFHRLTPDDLFDVLEERRIGWSEASMTGVAFHMASALAVAGRAGATAIGTTPAHADALFAAVHHALDQESRC